MPVRLLLILCLCAGSAKAGEEFDHTLWNQLLQAHVKVLAGGQATQVDYRGMQEDKAELRAYLAAAATVSESDFESWSKDAQLAFLINLYNAATVDLVAHNLPGIDSIRDLGTLFRSPWKQPIVSLFGGQVSLDEIEHDLIRDSGNFREPRIHFAVNCAAIGCPPLRAEAYIGARLSAQLEDNTRLFLSDRSRNYTRDGRLYVSRIFDWYAIDFKQSWQGVDSIADFLLRYVDVLGLNPREQQALKDGDLPLRYDRYDWGLNSVR
jgi:hypothetical protein